MADTIRAAVIGASGYTGGELIRLLLDHPAAEIAFASSQRHPGVPVGTVHPWLRNHPAASGLRLRSLEELVDVDVAFCCLPSGTLPVVLPRVAERAKRVLNLAGDFRLRDEAEVRAHYPASVGAPARGAESFSYYVPELSGAPPEGRFVNLPGCMAVASLYALFPLFADRLVEPRVVLDAKTGSTGAGRRTAEHPAERAGNFRVHKPFGHRHLPEIRQALSDFTGARPGLRFSTYSLDVPRGIVVTGYAQLRPGVTPLGVKRSFVRAYAGRPFVRVRPSPKTPLDYPMLKAVVGSNVAEVAVGVRGDEIVTVAALDNLVKGAAGQAIQAMNLLAGLDETTGLPWTAVAP
ncbi:N-acetyl-gamma-glutamyl-phosphate reductase [Streptomyces sp. NBC_01803]|uniref:N-acetyl-gamma-glutamyl-phosphate reductase n=1 Tax=Streptomyces sp. NBC_01803 TaxID=2975946 RepID=UPI002DDC710D|nr:N-acetyl-gamma-glutamyl-phosphate reductase [Streptomyces sp. NBC_01803]WSA43125.1 N-acetyl-gamma-glutamyl-phosphate reductase [Streptomyces sp. NBC_01803]